MRPELDRRRFLVLASAGAIGAVSCRATSEATEHSDLARSDTSSGVAARANAAGISGDASDVLRRAFERARARGVPLLALATDTLAIERSGRAWGVFLDLAPDEACAELALCEIVYAPAADVLAAWPVERPVNEPKTAALVVEPETGRVLRVACAREPLTQADIRRPVSSLAVPPWIAETAANLHVALAPDEAVFLRRARVVLGRAPVSRDACEVELAKDYRRAFASSAPAGAKWAARQDCGTIEFEDGTRKGPDRPIACGVAMIPAESRRFLWHYAADPR